MFKNKKNKAFKKFKKSGSSIDYLRYSVCRANYNKINMLYYKNYINNIKINLNNNPKSFYKFINLKKKSTGYPSTMIYKNTESSDDATISNMFADFFFNYIFFGIL